MKSPFPEEEGESEMCEELTATPVPYPPCTVAPLPHPPALWGAGREFGSEVESRKNGGVGGRCFQDLVLFLIIIL